MAIARVMVREKITFTHAMIMVGLLVLAVAAPAFGSQIITGSIINAILFYVAIRYGILPGIAVALLPSPIALMVGLLPFGLAPLLPMIIAGNCLLVFLVAKLTMHQSFSFLIAAIAKAAVITLGAFLFMQLADGQLAKIASQMFTWMQLITAGIGAVLAFGFLQFYQKQKRDA